MLASAFTQKGVHNWAYQNICLFKICTYLDIQFIYFFAKIYINLLSNMIPKSNSNFCLHSFLLFKYFKTLNGQKLCLLEMNVMQKCTRGISFCFSLWKLSNFLLYLASKVTSPMQKQLSAWPPHDKRMIRKCCVEWAKCKVQMQIQMGKLLRKLIFAGRLLHL